MTKVRAKHQSRGNWLERLLVNPSNPYKIICITCIVLYAQILTFGLVQFDDHGFVLLAADNLKLSNIPEFFNHSVFWVMGDTSQENDVFYRPLQNVVYALCNTIATKQPWIYHLAGLLFHAIVSCILFRFFKELKFHVTIALVCALVYAFHPVLVQGVAWIAGIGDQMAAMFALLSMIFFIRMFSGEKIRRNYFIHLGFLTCALFSKEVSIAVIPLCLFWYFFRPNPEGGKPINTQLFFSPFRAGAIAIGWGVVVTAFFIFRSSALRPSETNLLGSAIGSFKVNGLLVFEYFEKIFLPWRLSPIPSREDAHLLIGAVLFLVLLAFLIYKKRFTRMAAFGAIWFVAFLFPTFIQQNPEAHFFSFEHRLYLPLIGMIILLIELTGLKEININSSIQKFGFGGLLLVLSGATFSHSRTFTDPYTFYDKAISSSPKSVIAYNGYGKFLLTEKKYAEAIGAFKKSHEYKSDDVETTGKIGQIYMDDLKNPAEAIIWYKKTMEIDPNSIKAAVNTADAYLNALKDTVNAEIWYKRALTIDPQNTFALSSMGMIHMHRGNLKEARNLLVQSIVADPDNLMAHKWIAISFFNEGNMKEAIRFLGKAYLKYPEDVDLLRNLMICYYKSGDVSGTEKFAVLYSKTGNPVPAEIEAYLKASVK